MWMCYSEAARSEPTDLRSAVEHLVESLWDCAFEAAHEVVYGLGRSGLSDEQLRNEEKQYNNGAVVCRLFLGGSISRSELVDLMSGLGLESHMNKVHEFIEKEDEVKQPQEGLV